MVFCGLYPSTATSCPSCVTPRQAEAQRRQLHLRTRVLPRLGFGFRCGFLGSCTWRSCASGSSGSSTSLIATARRSRTGLFDRRLERGRRQPTELPEASRIERIDEPMLTARPHAAEYTGTVMELCRTSAARWPRWSTSPRATRARLPDPLAEVVVDFFDQLKSAPRATPARLRARDYQTADLVRVTCSSTTCPSTPSRHCAPLECGQLRATHDREATRAHPRQLFDVPIQAAIGGRWWPARPSRHGARMSWQVLRRGHHRKRKLLERQKEGRSA